MLNEANAASAASVADAASAAQYDELKEGDVVAWMYSGKIVHAAIVLSLKGHMHLLHCANNSENIHAIGSSRPFSGVMLTSVLDEIGNGRAAMCVILRPTAKTDVRTLRLVLPSCVLLLFLRRP